MKTTAKPARAFFRPSAIRSLIAAALFVCSTGATPPLFAQTTPSAPPRTESPVDLKLRKRGDLLLRDASLPDALLTISRQWDISIVSGSDVEGKVNCAFRNAPLNEVLNSILFANKYGYRPVEGSLVVMKLESLGEANPMLTQVTIQLNAISPDAVLEAAKTFLSSQGKVQAISSARMLLVKDFPDCVERVRNWVEQVDKAAAGRTGGARSSMADGEGGGPEAGGPEAGGPEAGGPEAGGPGGGLVSDLETLVLDCHFVKAEAVQEALSNCLSSEGKVQVIDGENRLLAYDYPPQLEKLQQALKMLDTPRPLVRITALIYDVGLGDAEDLGFNWTHALKGPDFAESTDDEGNEEDPVPLAMWGLGSTLMPELATGGAMTFMRLHDKFDITAIVHALQSAEDSRLLANPSIVVENHAIGKLGIVTEIPYQQLTETAEGGSMATTAFREVGITLEVTPRIANDGTVQLEVEPVFSRLAGYSPGDNQPIIDKREEKTTVRVANRETLVIGGLRQRTETKTENGLPWLKDLPFHIGKLFRGHTTTVRESELVVFITPQLVSPFYRGLPREAAAAQITRPQLDAIPTAPETPFPLNADAIPPWRRGRGVVLEEQEYYEEIPPDYEGYGDTPAVAPEEEVPTEAPGPGGPSVFGPAIPAEPPQTGTSPARPSRQMTTTASERNSSPAYGTSEKRPAVPPQPGPNAFGRANSRRRDTYLAADLPSLKFSKFFYGNGLAFFWPQNVATNIFE